MFCIHESMCFALSCKPRWLFKHRTIRQIGMLLVVNFLTISKSLYRYFYWKLRHWTHVVESLTDKVQRDVMKEEIEKSWIIEDGRFTPKTKISSRELFVLLPTLHRTHFPTSVIEDMSSANNIIRINDIDCEKNIPLSINRIVQTSKLRCPVSLERNSIRTYYPKNHMKYNRRQ